MNSTDQVCEDCGLASGPELAAYQNGPEVIVLCSHCAAEWNLPLVGETQAEGRFKVFAVDARDAEGRWDEDDLVGAYATIGQTRQATKARHGAIITDLDGQVIEFVKGQPR